MANSRLEQQFALGVQARGLPAPVTEYRFAALHAGGTGNGLRLRLATAGLCDWRFDFAWPDRLVAAEIDGGIWTRGRHTRGAGFIGDLHKMNAAAWLGWRVIRFTGEPATDAMAWRILTDLLI